MVGKGVKRKRHADGGLDSCQNLADCPESYSLKRQLVLNTSLNKMQNGRALPELSLRRTVLIANTLRQIQEEIRLESSQLASAMALDSGCSELGSQRDVPPSRLTTESHPAGFGDGLEDFTSAASDEDHSLSSAINSILRDLDIIVDESPSPSIPQDNLDLPEAMDTAAEDWDKEEIQSTEPSRPLESVFGSFEIMSSSYLVGVTLDDLFLDIDTSVCDCDVATVGPAPSGRAVPPGVADDLAKTFTSCNSSSSLGANPTLRTDLNDLDHIMEILVSS
ncbi:SERTA domain-containing protein 2-like [Hemiscyllium ocellatum]|uniref:SERTA domain-containing protein 2-like n=1 Tax=Hemiscyllium ocellatum TaxID=170820 RepID=UPI002966EDBB|nr:SERTA domain-containing protein 2-like [Hemiscyllium ocellatum]XP_060712152.1 SERTA domain-containing protein 2-like [Hemiscyllium ocellatum]